MMHVFFFSFVRITSCSILFVFPYFYVHIYLLVIVDGYIDRCQASYVLGGSVHHHWVSALKRTKFHVQENTIALSLVFKEPWYVFLAPITCH